MTTEQYKKYKSRGKIVFAIIIVLSILFIVSNFVSSFNTVVQPLSAITGQSTSDIFASPNVTSVNNNYIIINITNNITNTNYVTNNISNNFTSVMNITTVVNNTNNIVNNITNNITEYITTTVYFTNNITQNFTTEVYTNTTNMIFITNNITNNISNIIYIENNITNNVYFNNTVIIDNNFTANENYTINIYNNFTQNDYPMTNITNNITINNTYYNNLIVNESYYFNGSHGYHALWTSNVTLGYSTIHENSTHILFESDNVSNYVEYLKSTGRFDVHGLLNARYVIRADDGDGSEVHAILDNDYLPTIRFEVDGTNDKGRGYVIAQDGRPQWDFSVYQGEDSTVLYNGYNYENDETLITGNMMMRLGVNKQDNINNGDVGFIGTGLNDMTSGGVHDDAIYFNYEINITSTGTPNQFSWRYYEGTGTSWSNWSTPINITGAEQEIKAGDTVTFASTTGHTLGDQWYFTAFSQVPPSTFSINPPSLSHLEIYNGSVYKDYTFEAGTTGGTPFNAINRTGQYIYWGRHTKTTSLFINVANASSGLTLKFEYWNGTTWNQMTLDNCDLIDGTNNLAKSGSITWAFNELADWSPIAINLSHEITVDDHVYMLRMSTTTNGTGIGSLNALSNHGTDRFSVYQSAFDTTPVFNVAPNGDVTTTGTFNAKGFYGEMFNSNSIAYTLTTQNTWYNITQFNGTGELNGWSLDSNKYILNCTQAGIYQVSYTFSVTASNNDNGEFRAVINGTVENKSISSQSFNTGKYQTVSNTFIKRFNVGDTLYMQQRDITRSNEQFTHANKNVAIIRLGT